MDGSRRSGHGNAYFTGFGSNKRIVFFAIGFETTAPVNALSIIKAKNLKLDNYFVLSNGTNELPQTAVH